MAENIKFEDAMKRLDRICDELSREGVALDEALALYEEGVKLVRACNEKLEATERRIKMLQISADGELKEEDFTESSINWSNGGHKDASERS